MRSFALSGSAGDTAFFVTLAFGSPILRRERGAFMHNLEELIDRLNELKTNLLNSSPKNTLTDSTEKRKALLKLELNLQKLRSLKLKQKSNTKK